MATRRLRKKRVDPVVKLCIEAIEATNRTVMDIIHPPGTIPFLVAAWVVGVPGLIFLFWLGRF